MKQPCLLILSFLIVCIPAYAQKKKPSGFENRMSGLAVTVDAGLLIPNSKQAAFYRGTPDCPNTINRVLLSQQYGTAIWNSLVNQGLISPSAIPSYHSFQIAEYGKMAYKLSYQIGVGIRYDYPSGWGWLLRFDFSQLTAASQFLLSSTNGTGILGRNQYVACDIYGQEKRIFIDLGIAKRIPLSNKFDLEFDLGFDLNNTKVSKHAINVGGKSYSILDVWNGASPDVGTGSIPYINQGGIGIGGFGSLALGYLFNGAGIDLGYSAYFTQTKYKGFNDNDCFALQHVVFLRFCLNNFSFFSK